MPENDRAIGGYDVDSRWVHPVAPENRIQIPKLTEDWKVRHMLRSRYFVSYKKCSDVSCCSPYRSPLESRLPSGFLPAPRAYCHNEDGDLALCDPSSLDKKVRFASLSNILAQPVQQNLPFDTYNSKIDINKVRCPFCRITLCSPTELQRHSRAMHYRQRASAIEPFQIEELSIDNSILEIIDKSEDEYLCIMEDEEDIEWRRLPPTHPLIPLFEKERQRLLEGINDGPEEIPHSELANFMSSVFEDI